MAAAGKAKTMSEDTCIHEVESQELTALIPQARLRPATSWRP